MMLLQSQVFPKRGEEEQQVEGGNYNDELCGEAAPWGVNRG